MEQKKLQDDLKNRKFRKTYLLYGTERFLVDYYAESIETAVSAIRQSISPLDKGVFDGAIPPNDIIMSANSLSIFSDFTASDASNSENSSDLRLIYVKNSGLFTSGRKADSETMAEFITNIPEETCIVFIESDVDKRGRLFKKLAENGLAVNCETPNVQTLAGWAVRHARAKNKIMTPATANYFVRVAGSSMSALSQEVDKLANYIGERQEITGTDIDAICAPTLESRIFDLTRAMCSGEKPQALQLYRDMLILKESPIMVLSMIIRQFRIILLTKCAEEKGLSKFQMTKDIGVRDFAIDEAQRQGRRFTQESLLSALNTCLETDVKIKTGLIAPELGVEMIILNL